MQGIYGSDCSALNLDGSLRTQRELKFILMLLAGLSYIWQRNCIFLVRARKRRKRQQVAFKKHSKYYQKCGVNTKTYGSLGSKRDLLSSELGQVLLGIGHKGGSQMVDTKEHEAPSAPKFCSANLLLPLALMVFCVRQFFVGGGCPMYCRMFSSIPGFSPLDPSSIIFRVPCSLTTFPIENHWNQGQGH